MKLFKVLIISLLSVVLLNCRNSETKEGSIDKEDVELNKQSDVKVEDTSIQQQGTSEQLPYFQINNDDAIPLDEDKIKIELEDYHSDNDFKIIVKSNEFSVLVLFSYYDFGNYDEYIVTLDNQGKQLSKLLVYYNTAPDGNVEKYEYSDYYLFKKSLDLDVFKVSVVENLETQQVLKKDTIKTSYKINKKGVIEKK
ncbi:hypothetical protein SAMN05444344_2646 [Tenacibaculum mesophilum]|uniref:Uncharacterized protein n=1 Tax=Tenacibaculum mesophilum TaxID=104268 RepID=A0AAE9SG64_9FLAO|nr:MULTISPECIES: hypothetical protein [Tenacibaculum]GFD97052.1 hypothetical protein KUL154_57850 [Alteromonas sp. KUL154]GFE03690.1 hypothetical protein KUL156_62820 [Alteromonas sp. KUL156]AZJ32555.1 hypothetical protein D6200_08325 [Tenacibaculum mesophilum]MDO6676594.1 hypothetical protein [Tenacibaculum sp. 1_MG-2023]QFS27806.1 hypothetical protein F9Y86_05165 [Tenacibaculum mesophilum]